ncbi:MAG: FecR domain-containing protein, partial [Desulfobacteraceae bacterium]|nr:FecR domain-containing protein [Desulfobacteraceae bacterium]
MDENTASGKAIGVVVGLQGHAQAVSETGTRELSTGSELFQGEKIVTKEDGQIEIKFTDNTILSQGKNSEVLINAYVYDPEEGSHSNLLLQMGKGVFRTVTGEIAKQNPDNFNLQSPMALIGIRGTTVVGQVFEDSEKWGVEEIGKGHVLVVKDSFGNIQFISNPDLIIDFFKNQPIGPARPLTPEELDFFKLTAPIDFLVSEIGPEKAVNDGRETEGADSKNNDADNGELIGIAGGQETPEGYSSEDPIGEAMGDVDSIDQPEGFSLPQNLEPSTPVLSNPVLSYQEPLVLGLIDYTSPEDPVFYIADSSNAEPLPVTNSGLFNDSIIRQAETVITTVTETPAPPVENVLPVIGGDISGSATEYVDPDGNTLLETSGVLTISDPDAGESVFITKTIT